MAGMIDFNSTLDRLRTTELSSLGNRLFGGRFSGRDADLADRHGIRLALSGLLCGEIDVLAGDKLCMPEREFDFVLPGRLPIRWSRFYSSALSTVGMLGPGWRVEWEATLERLDGKLIYTDAFGRVIVVPCPEPGERVTVLSERLHLACLSDGTMVVADFVPRYRVFDEFDERGVARLKYIEGAGGDRIGCIRDESGRLIRMRDTSARELRMHYGGDGRLLTSIESVGDGPVGCLVRYGYDEDGALAEIHDAMGAVRRRFRYEYGQMVEETGPLGGVTRYAWSTVGGKARVSERTTDSGAREQFSYEAGQHVSEVCDVFGNTAMWRYDRHGCVVEYKGFDGKTHAFQYGSSHWPVVLRLAGERRIALTLDHLSRVVKEVSPGTSRQTSYDSCTLEPSAIKLADGRGWTCVHNDQFQLVQSEGPDGGTVQVEYDDRGRILRYVDAGGGSTLFQRDAAGRVTRMTDTQGRIFEYTHDANGNVSTIRDAMGAETRVECNVFGLPLVVVRPDGVRERHVWNAMGQRVEFVGPDGHTRQWQRDSRGRVICEVNEEGHRVEYQYDAHGGLVSATSANGAVQTFVRDAIGRLLAMTDENGVTRTFVYADDGAVARISERAGSHSRSESFQYDEVGRLVGRETQHSVYQYTYGADGRLERVCRTPTPEGEALGIAESFIRFEYDHGKGPSTEEGEHGKLHYGYGSTGNLEGVLLPQRQTLQLVRDNHGAVTLIGFDGHHVAEFRHDAMKRETLRMQGDLLTYTGHDDMGMPVWWRSVLASETADRDYTAADIRLWREAHYSAAGQAIQTAGHQYGTTYCDYDRSGNLLRRVSDELGVEWFSWDGSGNPIDPSITHREQMRRGHHRLAECRGWLYEYDAWGQVIRKGGNRRTMEMEWDAEGHLLAVRQRDRNVRYQYDALGRCITRSVTFAQSPGRAQPLRPPRVTRFVWQDNQLIQELEGDRVRTYLYLPRGAGYVSDTPLACIDQVVNPEGVAGDTQIHYYQTDANGSAEALTDAQGSMVWFARYRPLVGLLAQAGASAMSQPLRLPGHFADDETGMHWHGSRVYDPDSGRYASPYCKRAGANPYRLDAARPRRFQCPMPLEPVLPDLSRNVSRAGRWWPYPASWKYAGSWSADDFDREI